MKLSMAYKDFVKVTTNLFPNFDFPGMVIFRRKNICGISTEIYVLCSFKLKKDLIFRICEIRMDLRVKSDIYQKSKKFNRKKKSSTLLYEIFPLWPGTIPHSSDLPDLGFLWQFFLSPKLDEEFTRMQRK
jgi:hypothetical protein